MDKEMKNTAILLIEFQKQWIISGPYNSIISEQLNSRNVLENTRSLVEKARQNGIKIIHAPLIIDPKNKRGWLAYLTLGTVFTKDKEKSEMVDGVYEQGDLVVKGRYAFDAFVGSNLGEILKREGIEKVFVCGFTTDQCVAKTMRTMKNKGFESVLVSDCTATFSSKIQKKVEKEFEDRVIESGKII